jgi:hypothetical protein
MADLQKDQKRDYQKFFIEDGEPGFSPDYNKYVIEKTIKKTNAVRRQKMVQFREGVAERSDAVATYLKSRIGEGVTPIEKYFGKQWMAYLRGAQIQNVLRTKLKSKERKVYLPK